MYCIVLYCIVLYCIVLYCIALYSPTSASAFDQYVSEHGLSVGEVPCFQLSFHVFQIPTQLIPGHALDLTLVAHLLHMHKYISIRMRILGQSLYNIMAQMSFFLVFY